MNVVITDEAEADLEQIGDYIAADNPVRAESFVQELVHRCMQLGEMPRGFPVVSRYAHAGVRRRIHGAYLIFYRIGAESIEVLRIMNGAQDYEAVLFPIDI